MTHAESQDLLLDLAYGELDAVRAAEVAAHVAGCAECAREQALLMGTRKLAAPLRELEEPSASFDARILNAARAEASLQSDGLPGQVIEAQATVKPLGVEPVAIDASARVARAPVRRKPRWALRVAMGGSAAAAAALVLLTVQSGKQQQEQAERVAAYRIDTMKAAERAVAEERKEVDAMEKRAAAPPPPPPPAVVQKRDEAQAIATGKPQLPARPKAVHREEGAGGDLPSAQAFGNDALKDLRGTGLAGGAGAAGSKGAVEKKSASRRAADLERSDDSALQAMGAKAEPEMAPAREPAQPAGSMGALSARQSAAPAAAPAPKSEPMPSAAASRAQVKEQAAAVAPPQAATVAPPKAVAAPPPPQAAKVAAADPLTPDQLEKNAQEARRGGNYPLAAALYRKAAALRHESGLEQGTAAWDLTHAVECLAAAGLLDEARAVRAELGSTFPSEEGAFTAARRALREFGPVTPASKPAAMPAEAPSR